MKTMRVVLVVVIALLLISSGVIGQNKYVGVKACKPCHQSDKQGKQFDIWSKSSHASAVKTLESPKAAEIAKAKGLTKSAKESQECLDCHAPAVDVKLADKGYVATDGVQCENCHGAGSAYKSMAVMKDKAKSVAAGLIDLKDEAAVQKLCKGCHNEKSPTFKGFNYKEMWEKIKHSVPKA